MARRKPRSIPRSGASSRAAQELAWQAIEARSAVDIEAMAALCDEAIELDLGCLDTHCMLLSHSDICLEDQVAVLCDLVMAGSEALGMRSSAGTPGTCGRSCRRAPCCGRGACWSCR